LSFREKRAGDREHEEQKSLEGEILAIASVIDAERERTVARKD